MNKKLIKVQILLFALLGVILLFLLLFGASGVLKGVQFPRLGKFEIVHEETLPLKDIGRIELDFANTDILVTVTEESDLRVVQLSNAELSPDEYFTVDTVNGELRIAQGQSRRVFSLFSYTPSQQLELYLPKSYAQSLSARTRSGNISLLSDLALQDLSFSLSSGNLSGGLVTGKESVEVGSSSGNVSLDDVSCNRYDISTSSGNISIGSLKGEGSAGTTSGNLSIGALDGARHDIRASSGDIRIARFSGSGNIGTTSGRIRVECETAPGDLRLSASSGDVRLTLPRNASYDLHASCSSGDINSDVDMSYSKNGKTATAKTGSAPYARIDIKTSSGDIDILQGGNS